MIGLAEMSITHICHSTSFDMCLCHCTEEKGGGGGGEGGDNDEKSIIKRL